MHRMDLSILDQSAFNLKHNCNVLDYVLAARSKKGLPSVAEQNPVLDPCEDNATHFVYCVRLDQVKKQIINCDPYNLVMLSYSKAKMFDVYYTASAYAITEVCNMYIVILSCAWQSWGSYFRKVTSY